MAEHPTAVGDRGLRAVSDLVWFGGGEVRQLGAVGDGKFGVDLREVGLDRCDAHEQALGDGGVGGAGGGQRGHLALGRGQAGPAGGGPGPTTPHPLGDGDGPRELE